MPYPYIQGSTAKGIYRGFAPKRLINRRLTKADSQDLYIRVQQPKELYIGVQQPEDLYIGVDGQKAYIWGVDSQDLYMGGQQSDDLWVGGSQQKENLPAQHLLT